MIQISNNVIYLPGNSSAETTVYCSGDSGDSGNSGDEHGKVHVEVQRFGYGTNSTIGIFEAYAYDNNGNVIRTMSGYMLEREYDPNRATTSGSETAIPSGFYTITTSVYGENQDKPCLRFGDVPGRSGILIHVGNNYHDSEGCLMTGTSYTSGDINFEVQGSRTKFNELLNFTKQYGGGNGTFEIKTVQNSQNN